MSLREHLAVFTMTALDMSDQYEKKKKEILDEWELTYSMPRKMKKKVRKRLNLEWSINEWGNDFNPFNFNLDNLL